MLEVCFTDTLRARHVHEWATSEAEDPKSKGVDCLTVEKRLDHEKEEPVLLVETAN